MAQSQADPSAATDAAGFARELRALKAWAGDPPLDELSRRTGIPRSTLGDAFSPRRQRPPALAVVRAIVLACGAEPAEVADWERAWLQLRVSDPPAAAGSRPRDGRPPWRGPRPFVTDLVGRTQDQDRLLDLLRRRRLVTVVGPGGVGKTALALVLAHRLTEPTEPAPPDGVAVVSLVAAGDGDEVLQLLATAVGVGGATGGEVLDEVERRLTGRGLLLVLDNCEHVVDACTALVRRLLPACPGLRVLATSRRSLGISDEVVWPLAPLTTPPAGRPVDPAGPAVALFLRLAADAAPTRPLGPADLSAVGAICRRLDGLPLALELAAGRLRTLGVGDLATRLEDDLGLVRGADPAAPGRHATLTAAVDWSYALLREDQQRLLARLSVFRGGFDIAAAEQVCGAPPLRPADVLPVLATLVDSSLVQRAGRRYGLLAPVHEYAADRLSELGETAATADRHVTQLLAWLRAGHALPRAADRVGYWRASADEIDNLRAGLERAFRSPAPAAAEMAALATGFWLVSGPHVSEYGWWVGRAADRRARLPPAAAAAVDLQLSRARAAGLDVAGALRTVEGALPGLAAAWPREYAEGLGETLLYRARLLDPGAPAAASAALSVLEPGALPRLDPEDAALVTCCVAEVLAEWGRYDAAAAALELSPPVPGGDSARILQHRWVVRLTIALGRGDLAAAAVADRELEAALALDRVAGIPAAPARVSQVRARYAVLRGEPAAAEGFVRDPILAMREVVPANLFGTYLPRLLLGTAQASVRRGELPAARRDVAEALDRLGGTSDLQAGWTAGFVAASVARAAGDAAAAADLAGRWDRVRRAAGLPAPLELAAAAAGDFGLDPRPPDPPPTDGGWDDGPVRSLMEAALRWART